MIENSLAANVVNWTNETQRKTSSTALNRTLQGIGYKANTVFKIHANIPIKNPRQRTKWNKIFICLHLLVEETLFRIPEFTGPQNGVTMQISADYCDYANEASEQLLIGLDQFQML